MISSCRVCGSDLHKFYVDDMLDDQIVNQVELWMDDEGDVLCPAKDWDDAAGPYHEPKDSV